MEMIRSKAICCLLLLNSLATLTLGARSNFEDADRGTDYTSSFSDNDQQFDIRHNIPGEPDIDYPIYAEPPKTSFTCDNRHEGYYADVETRCQVFRICTNTDLTGEGFAFLCPNGTLFSQRNFVCDWYRNVDCNESESYYFMNEKLGKIIKSKEDMMKAVREMVDYPVKTASKTFGTASQSTFSTQRPSSTVGGHLITHGHAATSQKTQDNRFNDHSRGSTSRQDQTSHRSSTSNGRQGGSTAGSSNQSQGRHGANNRQDNIHRNGDRDKSRNGGSTVNGSNRSNGRYHATTANNRNQQGSTGKIYVSNLGELSTDVGSTFDPKTSVILSDSNGGRAGQKKSLDQYFGNVQNRNEANENLKQNSQRVRTSLPGSINSQFGHRDQSQEELDSQSTYNVNAARGRLNFAERINAGLNGFGATGLAEENFGPDTGKILTKAVYTGEGNLISQSFTSQLVNQKPQPTGRLFNLAETINSAFGSDKNTGGFDHHQASDAVRLDSKNLVQKEEGSRTFVSSFSVDDLKIQLPPSQNRSSSQGFRSSFPTTKTPQTTTVGYRTGRGRFQLQGSAFTQSGQGGITSRPQPYRPAQYLPPLPVKPLPTQQPPRLPNQLNKGIYRVQLGVKLSEEDGSPEPKPTPRTEHDETGTIPSLLIDAEDKNAVEDIKPPAGLNDQDIHVKKRAENLLLQGFHLTWFEHNNNTNIEDNSIDNLQPATPLPEQTTVFPDFDDITTLPIIVVTDPVTDSEVTEPETETDATQDFLNKLDNQITSLNITTPLSESVPTNKTDNKTEITDKKKTTSLNASTLSTRRQTAKPINYSKKPFTTRNYPKTTTTRPIKLRRRPTSRFSITTENIVNAENSTSDATDFDKPNGDLTALANSYGVRANINRIQNETNNKYTILKRPKPHYTSYDDRKPNYNLKNRTRSSISNLNITLPTRIPSKPHRTETKNKTVEKHEKPVEKTVTEKSIEKPVDINEKHIEINEKLESNEKLETNSQTPSPINHGSTLPLGGSNHNQHGPGPHTLHPGQGFRTAFTPSHVVTTQTQHGDKPSTSYFHLPGTKVTIAKSEEGAHYTISNDPIYTRRPLSQTTQKQTHPTGVPQFKQHPFLPIEQYFGHGFTSHTQPPPPSQTTNFFLPFPTITPARKATTTHTGSQFPTFPPLSPAFQNNFYHTTDSPFVNIQPANTFYINNPTERTTFIDGFGTGSGLTTFPYLSTIQAAQRRLDVVEDEGEGMLYKGVSSYHVPLNSVGRLPGDIKGIRKKKR